MMFHLGESQAIRQMLGHRDLAAFVGNIHNAPYTPERRRMKHRAARAARLDTPFGAVPNGAL